jgi:hypothetical protein
MGSQIFIIVLLAIIVLGWTFWPSMKRAKKVSSAKPDGRLPHERYPRILNWRKGDRIRTRSGKYWPHFFAGEAKLLGLSADGSVFLKDYEKKWHLSVDDVCKNCWNMDASNREISEAMKASQEYTDALEDFNKSVRLLESRDKKNGVDLPEKYYQQVPSDLYI